MIVKPLFAARFQVVAVTEGDDCPAERFLLDGEETTAAARRGLLQMLQHVAENGWDDTPSAWSHEANKKLGIHEFIKGPLRLFFFKGANGQIAVCTCGVRKSGQKADKASVAKASAWRKEYIEATANNTLEVLKNEDE